MYVKIGDSAWGLERCVLVDPHDLSDLHVIVSGLTKDEVHRALWSEFAGKAVDDDHVWLSIDWLERSGAGSWNEADFAAMISRAQQAGWVDPAAGEVRAHIWSSSSP